MPVVEWQYRVAEQNDIDLIYTWNSDPIVRSQSFNSEPIAFEDHIRWFKRKMESASDLLIIATIEKKPAALVRFETSNHQTVVSLVLDNSFRGKGLSSGILKGAIEKYIDGSYDAVFAFIKKTNSVSVKSFERAGYEFVSEDLINNIQSLKYVYSKRG